MNHLGPQTLSSWLLLKLVGETPGLCKTPTDLLTIFCECVPGYTCPIHQKPKEG